jgi:hypothetical protein
VPPLDRGLDLIPEEKSGLILLDRSFNLHEVNEAPGGAVEFNPPALPPPPAFPDADEGTGNSAGTFRGRHRTMTRIQTLNARQLRPPRNFPS